MKNSIPTSVDLFCGAGGLMLGLKMAGFKTIAANEVHPDPCKTLKRNFPFIPIIQADIREFNHAQDLLLSAGHSKHINSEIDLLSGGPPCQGFSNAGIKDPHDPRNTLIGQFIRFIKQLKPRYFLLENVVGLKTLHGGKLFERVLDQLSDTKYNFKYDILFAADYGVPQMRKRLIILGSRDGKVPSFPKPTHSPHYGQISIDYINCHKRYVTCGDAIGDLPVIGQGEIATQYDKEPITEYQKMMRNGSKILYNHYASTHRKSTMDYYGLVPEGGTWLDIPKDLRKRKQGMQRWPFEGLSRTITTEPTDFLHPSLNRIPTIRELARIQSFPDQYEFLGQRTTGNRMRRMGYCSQSQQVGNAVPPLMGKAIGLEIIKELF